MAILHYIFDPLCGWCYGAAPLLDAVRGIDGLEVIPHGGGMMAGVARQPVTPALRRYVMQHDARIAQLTGQPFGERYQEGLLRDAGAVFDSGPPTTAILAAEAMAGRGLDFLVRLQHAHFIEGQRIADGDVLVCLAADIGLDAAAFAGNVRELTGAPTDAHIRASRALLARVLSPGFPTFALETGQALQMLDFGPFLGRPDAWREAVTRAIA